MSINFPTDLDTLTNPTATDKVATVDHAAQHANANDAIEALEAKVGKNSSGVTTSHDYKLSGVTGSDKAVSLTGNETLTNKTLTTPVINTPAITTPKITTSINDVNGNEVIKTPATASAVNEITVTNAATGNDPLVSATGGDDNISLKIKAKGTGKVKIGAVDLQFPNVDGNSGELITTNGSGELSWVGATTVPDASETVKGIVEEATDAEVVARTATGATGAKLFVTPTKLQNYPTIETTSGTTHSLTTVAGQRVIVWAKGNSGDNANAVIKLNYNGVQKDILTASTSDQKGGFALMYTETPGAATADITITTTVGSVSECVIIVMKF